MRICIFGASGRELDARYYTEAEAVGRLIGENGDSIVFGGGAEGLMGACARGVSAAGGDIVGIAPRFFDEPGILYDKCSRMIFTETMRERKQKMEDISDAFIAVAGGFGTFEELCEVITLKQLKQHKKSIVILNTHGFYDELIAMFEKTVEQKFAKEEALSVFTVVDTPRQAVEAVEKYHYMETGSKWFTPEAP